MQPKCWPYFKSFGSREQRDVCQPEVCSWWPWQNKDNKLISMLWFLLACTIGGCLVQWVCVQESPLL
jgi:hypothetical protein